MDQKRIGLFIAENRKKKQLTQQDLGDLLGVTNKSVSKWERGICLPDVSLFPLLCDELGIELNELFIGEHITEEHKKDKLEETILPMVRKNQRIKKIKKVVLIIGMILVPLIVIQWHLKFYGLQWDTDIDLTYIAYLALFYFLAFYLILKRVYLGYWISWAIYIILSFLLLSYCNDHVQDLFNSYSLDFWLNIFITILAFVDKDIDYKKIIKKQINS